MRRAKTSAAITLNLEWLSDCGGCHVAIIDLHERLLEVLAGVEIQRCPVLTDVKGYPPAKIGLVSGAIRTDHDRHAAEAMRKSCEVLVALGTCAVYGGIPGAALAHSRDEILDAAYTRNRTTQAGAPPSTRVSPLEKMVTPIDEVVDVDYYLPGCPPHPKFLFQILRALLAGERPPVEAENVCGRCRRAMTKTDEARLREVHEGLPDDNLCFLSQGYVCLGSVTLDRCLAPCPQNGAVCTGCCGPSLQILTEPNRDIRSELADRIGRLTTISPAAVVAHIEQNAKTHYSYAMATRMIGAKPTFLIRKWIAEVEAEQ